MTLHTFSNTILNKHLLDTFLTSNLSAFKLLISYFSSNKKFFWSKCKVFTTMGLVFCKLTCHLHYITSAKDCIWCNRGNPTMLNNPNLLFSKVEWCRYCNHLTTLNLSHFKVVEAMGLKLVASVPCNTIATLQNFIQIYQLVQYLLQEKQRHRHVNRQTDRLVIWEANFHFWKAG
jgi:hypothetical protein